MPLDLGTRLLLQASLISKNPKVFRKERSLRISKEHCEFFSFAPLYHIYHKKSSAVSSVVERIVDIDEAIGSIPIPRTTLQK